MTIEVRTVSARLAVTCGATSVLLSGSLLGALLGYTQKLACSSGGAWNNYASQFRANCYTDIYPLYYGEQLSDGKVPYAGHQVEYPVLIGGMMQVASWAVHDVADAYARGRDFYYVTVAMLAICLLAGVLATAYTAGAERRWTALLVALSPALIVNAYINWDLLAMALTACGMAAWAARRPALAGALLGLAVAAKFYPLLIFGALFLLCLRAGQLRAFGRCLAAGAIAWLVVNLPVAIVATAGWGKFYAFSRSRGADWGSVWYMFGHYNVPLLGSAGKLNLMSTALFAVAAVAVGALTLAAARRPRVPQVAFLLLAAFLISNKVWSPQYAVWLVPVAVLARPRWWPYVLWQLAELAYFFGIWGYFVFMYAQPNGGGVSTGWYFATLVARLATVTLLAAYVISDIIRPERDVARAQGTDDPAGGVLDGAPDRFRLKPRRAVPSAS